MDKKFLLFLIGGAPDDSSFIDDINRVFTKVNNVDLVISGYMFPIPAKLLECFDALFSSSGGCWVCMRSGVPTIAIDGNDYMPIGIMKHTTINSLFRSDDEPILDYQVVFEDVIINKKYKNNPPKHEINELDFKEHLNFIKCSVATLDYFDMSNIQTLTNREKKLRIGLILLGATNYYKLNLIKNQIKNKSWFRRNV